MIVGLELEVVRALHHFLLRWRKPDAELDADSRTWILRYSGAYRMLWWCAACIPVALTALRVAPFDLLQKLTVVKNFLAFASVLMLCAVVYMLLYVYRRRVWFDEDGFTLGRTWSAPVWAAWSELRSAAVLDVGEKYLVLRKERGTAYISLHLNGLARFADYLEQHASVEIPAEALVMIPELDA